MSTANQKLAPAPSMSQQIFGIILGAAQARCLAAAAELELADRLASGPVPVELLASQTNTDADSLFRMMRALETIGFFRQASPRVFENSPMSELLRKDVPGSQWAFVRMFAPGWGFWEGLGHLLPTLQKGHPALFDSWGYDIWGHYQRNPDQLAVFNKAMRGMTSEMTPAVTAAYDWSRFPVIADIGGGVGAQVVDILNAHPGCRGVLFDQAEVIADAIKHERLECKSGSFFESVPVEADVYILRNIIHDWNNEMAASILKTLRKSTGPKARVVLVEWLIPETSDFHPGKWTDIFMMTGVSGKERTRSDFAELFRSTGFELEEIVPTQSAFSIVVARPV